MNPELERILLKHQRTPASQPTSLFPEPCPQCGTHGRVESGCPFSSDEKIIDNLVRLVLAEMPTRDVQGLVRLLCTEGPRIALELHEANVEDS